MPVRKLRSVEEMTGPAPLPPLDPENLRLAFGLTDLGDGLFPIRYTPGVRKFRSFDELLRAREEREQEQIRRSRLARGAG